MFNCPPSKKTQNHKNILVFSNMEFLLNSITIEYMIKHVKVNHNPNQFPFSCLMTMRSRFLHTHVCDPAVPQQGAQPHLWRCSIWGGVIPQVYRKLS